MPTARSVPGAWLAPAASPWGGGGPAAGQGGPQAPAVNVPSWLAGSDGGVRVGMGMGTGPVGAAMSVTAAPQPPPGLAVPVSMVDDVDVALPSFAAFRWASRALCCRIQVVRMKSAAPNAVTSECRGVGCSSSCRYPVTVGLRTRCKVPAHRPCRLCSYLPGTCTTPRTPR